jgi:hypothetical protein
LPYTANTATLKLPTVYPGAKLIVLAAPTVQVTGEGLQPGGQEQGMTVYGRESLPANDLFTVNVSGTAPPPSPQGDATGGGPGQEQQGGGIVASPVTVTQIPGRLDVLKWPLVAGFVGLFALGAILLARKPVVAIASGAAYEGPDVSSGAKKKIGLPQASPAGSSSANLAEVDAAVSNSLDSLKDQIFRLELRRQAGTISEDEYAQERARTEKVLRDLVRG